MFTSRAEHRLLFNHGSSEIRYLDYILRYDLHSASRRRAIAQKADNVKKWVDSLNRTKAYGKLTFADLIRKDAVKDNLPDNFINLCEATKDEVLYRVKYDGYLQREIRNVEKLKDAERIKIPLDFVYDNIPGLKTECAEKLTKVKPETLAQASRISGVDPSAISVLMILIEKQRKTESLKNE